MNNKLLQTFLLLLLLTLSTAAKAQKYVVMGITGSVKVESAGVAKHELKLREVLTPTSIINIGYKGRVELLDEAGRKKYTLKVPGKGTIAEMLKDRNNSTVGLTAQYLSYAQSRIRGNGELTSRHYSDPATVTREVAIKRTPYEEEFFAFQQEAAKKYDDFRLECIQTYADFLRSSWQRMGSEPPRRVKPEPELPPQPAPKEEVQEEIIEEKLVPVEDTIVVAPDTIPQPVPVQPIREVVEEEPERLDFLFYGTPLSVSFTQKETVHLKALTEQAIADAFAKMASTDFNNTIRDCLELRITYSLSDWAYLQMLEALGHACYPDSENDALLLTAYLFQQSGYKMRLAMTEENLVMLYASRHTVYNQPYYILDGDNFYVYGGDVSGLSISMASYPGETPLSLRLSERMMLAENPSEPRRLTSERYGDISLVLSVNKNLIDFFNTYPTSMIDDNMMTRWAMYANMPIEASLEASMIEELRGKLRGLSKFEAAERLLNWVQTAFVYKLDDEVWGGDRAFFAEESIYYPYCDCEDRSILFSRLVRDLLGLKVCLVYYPGHLATAVCFKGEGQHKGDFFLVGGEPYIVCDPTFIGARIGLSQSSANSLEAKLIVLE